MFSSGAFISSSYVGFQKIAILLCFFYHVSFWKVVVKIGQLQKTFTYRNSVHFCSILSWCQPTQWWKARHNLWGTCMNRIHSLVDQNVEILYQKLNVQQLCFLFSPGKLHFLVLGVCVCFWFFFLNCLEDPWSTPLHWIRYWSISPLIF